MFGMIRCFIQYRLRCTLRQGVIKMKKKIGLAVISILICGFAFAGCAGKNDTDVAKLRRQKTHRQRINGIQH